jgi:membrane associated rhomboid family serine protease
MLIIPLHKKPTVATFPWVTALLVVVNVFVYFALQRPDDAREQRAVEAYAGSRLAQIELPVYRSHVERTPTIAWREQWQRLPPQYQQQVLAMQIHHDDTFLGELRADRVITAERADFGEWKALRARFDQDWRPSLTQRNLMRHSEVAPTRMFSAMFLHGDGGHLIGNMVFLVILGLVVEPVLGSFGFLALYLLAGLGGAAFSLAWRWGTVGGMLGASGAIAGLMGAYAVLWGRRRVRLFYWFFVLFDYTRVRALWLLPVWLGWELFQLAVDQGSNIGFDVHAGGIVSGAALGLLATRLGRVNRPYLDEEETRDRRAEELAAGLVELGKLQLVAARARFDALARQHPNDPDVIEPWLRSWLFAKDRPESAAVVAHALGYPARTRDAAQRQLRWFNEALKALAPRVVGTPEVLIRLAERWRTLGLLAEAATVLAHLEQTTTGHDALPTAWFALALAHQERRDEAGARRLLAHLRARYPQSAEAGKAARLLG